MYEASPLAQVLAKTCSLAEAEEVVRAAYGASEIDHERQKAVRLRARAVEPDREGIADRAAAFLDEAARRGVDLVTCRRIAEGVTAVGVEMSALRAALARRPSRCGRRGRCRHGATTAMGRRGRRGMTETCPADRRVPLSGRPRRREP